MSFGVGGRLVLDPTLLWLWHRLAATASIRPLAWEPPYTLGVALKRQKKKSLSPLIIHFSPYGWQPDVSIQRFLSIEVRIKSVIEWYYLALWHGILAICKKWVRFFFLWYAFDIFFALVNKSQSGGLNSCFSTSKKLLETRLTEVPINGEKRQHFMSVKGYTTNYGMLESGLSGP